jgi:hypothetical protein
MKSEEATEVIQSTNEKKILLIVLKISIGFEDLHSHWVYDLDMKLDNVLLKRISIWNEFY